MRACEINIERYLISFLSDLNSGGRRRWAGVERHVSERSRGINSGLLSHHVLLRPDFYIFFPFLPTGSRTPSLGAAQENAEIPAPSQKALGRCSSILGQTCTSFFSFLFFFPEGEVLFLFPRFFPLKPSLSPRGPQSPSWRGAVVGTGAGVEASIVRGGGHDAARGRR